MKQVSAIAALAVVCMFTGSTALAAAGQPINLLANGGFEEGLTGWTPDAEHDRLADAGAAHSGNACLTRRRSPSRTRRCG